MTVPVAALQEGASPPSHWNRTECAINKINYTGGLCVNFQVVVVLTRVPVYKGVPSPSAYALSSEEPWEDCVIPELDSVQVFVCKFPL